MKEKVRRKQADPQRGTMAACVYIYLAVLLWSPPLPDLFTLNMYWPLIRAQIMRQEETTSSSREVFTARVLTRAQQALQKLS